MKLKRISALILSAFVIFSQISVFAELSETTTAENTASAEETAPDEVVPPQAGGSNFTLPKNVRATVLTPTVDFIKNSDSEEGGEAPDMESAAAELDSLYEKLSQIGLNTVYINTVYEGKAYYNTDMNDTQAVDYTALALEKGYSNNFHVYMVFDLNYALENCDKGVDKLDSLISNIHRFTLKYRCDGIVLDNYYGENNEESYSEYMRNGSGIGYDNWLYDSNEMYVKAACQVIHTTDNSIPVGLSINDMWANASSKEGGSDTADTVQAYFDGFADTKKYVEKDYVDFCTVKAYGSTSSAALPFEAVTSWWNKLSEDNNITLYVMHFNEKQGQALDGWGGVDQTLKQLKIVKELSAFGGSVFHSCQSLITDTYNTENITKFYGDQINEDSLFQELKMQSPSKLNFITYEPYVDFMGTFDENFEVLFNGVKVKLNEAGNFYFEEPLEIGINKFTIEHKGKAYQYNIERKIITLKDLDSSIANGKIITVNGESRVEIACIAYKGSTVTASLNGKTISLKESESQLDDDSNSSYRRFVGYYTVPAGIIGQEQNLGSILVTSSCYGYTQSLYGATVKVMALPEPPKDIVVDIDDDQNSAGSGEVVGTMDPVHTDQENVKYIKVSKDFTNVYNGNTSGSILTPDFAQLPAGTLDYLLADSGDYYITESGKRLRKDAVTAFADTGLGKNALVVKSSGTKNGYSYFKIHLDYKISYNIAFVGNNYYSGGDGDFNLNDFTATQVYITFDNVTSVTKLPSFEYNYVFSSGKWETVNVNGVPKFRMVLTLRQPKVYSGCGATYDGDGDLLLKFDVLTNVLSGMVITIDPGHGYGQSATRFDPGAVGYVTEFDTNLAIAKELESQLRALGVTPIRIKSESEFAYSPQRPAQGRAYGADMYISIHANKMQGVETARGVEAYYFTPYSQPLAAAITAQIADYFTHNVYSDGASKNRGAKYSYYYVTLQQDFPSILLETGFVSNEEEALALANPVHQKNIAARIIKGIQNYISRSNINQSFDGSDNPDIPIVTSSSEATAAQTPDITTSSPDASQTEASTQSPVETTSQPTEATPHMSEEAQSETTPNTAEITDEPTWTVQKSEEPPTEN